MLSSLVKRQNPYSYFPMVSTRAFDRMFEEFERSFSDSFSLQKEIFGQASTVPYDIIALTDDNGNEIGTEIRYALSEYNKEDINVEVDDTNSTLIVSVEKKDSENKNRVYKYKGIKRSKWQSSYYLGEQVNKNEISSRFENGTLILTIPFYNEDNQPKKLPVRSITIN